MNKRLKIGVDVDGVLSSFVPAARELCKQLFDGRPDDSLVQTSWSFESLGITKEEENLLWQKIDSIPNWWLTHQRLSGTSLLYDLCDKHRVVFITNRKDGTGLPIEVQTAEWLRRKFWLHNPNVIISDNKGPLAAGLKLDAFVDDRSKNVLEVLESSSATKTYLLNTSYNQECEGVPRVSNFDDFARLFLDSKTLDRSDYGRCTA